VERGHLYGGGRRLAIRAHPLVFGVVVFLASELMFFAGLFAAYYDLRSIATGPWPPRDVHLDLVESSVGTFLLALSSGTALLMTHSLHRDRFRRARIALGATIVLGTVFLLIAIHGWINSTYTVGSHAYGSLFFTMTGFHACHVLVGVLLLTALFFGVRWASFNRNERAGAEAISYYWHFVFIVWLGIWGSLYLVR
jgi:cytochrome c oxidase subunit 3